MDYSHLEGSFALIENAELYRYKPTLVKIIRIDTEKEYKKSWLTGYITEEKTVIKNVFIKPVGENYGSAISFKDSRYKDWQEMVNRATSLMQQTAIALKEFKNKT